MARTGVRRSGRRLSTVKVVNQRVDVVLPVLDEADALGWVLGRMPEGYRPIVVDNGSTDDSASIAESLGAMVVREPQRGFGAACFAGLRASDSELLCFMDADASLDPVQLPLVSEPVRDGRAELVLGARVAEPGAWPLHARLGNRVLVRSLRRRGGVALRDLGPMRAARREDLLALGLRDRRFGWPLEMVIRAGAEGWRVAEVDVTYSARAGRSKVSGTVRGTVRAARDMATLLRAVSKDGTTTAGPGAGAIGSA